LVAERRHGDKRASSKQEKRERHVDNGVGRQRESRGQDREHQGADAADLAVEEPAPEPPDNEHEKTGGQRGRQPRGELRDAKQSEACHLERKKEWRLIEKRLAVIYGY